MENPPRCVGCRKTPEEIDEYVEMKDAGETATQYCIAEEGTYNRHTGTFYCDRCYIRAGQPLGKAPALDGVPGPLPVRTELRENVDKMLAPALSAIGIDVRAVPKGPWWEGHD